MSSIMLLTLSNIILTKKIQEVYLIFGDGDGPNLCRVKK